MAEGIAEVRIVKKKKGHAGHHGGAWKVAYADFVTAMMAFFLVMWIVGMDQSVKDAVAGYFKDPKGFMAAVKAGGGAPFSVAGLDEGDPTKEEDKGGDARAERQKLGMVKEALERIVSGNPQFKDIQQYVDIQLIDEGLRIDLLEAKESLFFDSASATIKPGTRHLLAMIADEVGKLPNKIAVEGHTDSRPLTRRENYTNWELSADRANSARRIMENSGLKHGQVAQVRGYADTQPRNPKDPSHFTNRRVSIIVVMKDAMGKQSFSNPKSEQTIPSIDPGIKKPLH